MAAKSQMQQIRDAIWGNGKKGLITRMELVEADLVEMKWWLRVIGSAVILYVLNSWLGLV